MPTNVPSNPGWYTGYIPSSAEWAAEWSNKVDYPAPINQGGTGAQTSLLANYNLQQRTLVGAGMSTPLALLTRYGVSTSTGHATLLLPPLAQTKLGDWIEIADTDYDAATNVITIQANDTEDVILFGVAETTQQINVDGGSAFLVVTAAGWVMFSSTSPAPAAGSVGASTSWVSYVNGVPETITAAQLATYVGGVGSTLVVGDGTDEYTGINKIVFTGATVTNTIPGEAEVDITGGGGSLEVTDGTTTVTAVTEIHVAGATVASGGAGIADLSISGGGAIGASTAAIVQVGSAGFLNGTGTLTLPNPAVAGNMIVIVMTGGGPQQPGGFDVLQYEGYNTTNCYFYFKIAAGGEDSFTITTGDRTNVICYELENIRGIAPYTQGGNAGNAYNVFIPKPIITGSIYLLAFAHDNSNVWVPSTQTGVTYDFIYEGDGSGNHYGGFGHTVANFGAEVLTGSAGTGNSTSLFVALGLY